mmetsp:Transcript_58313/g.104746  ORF Transcript_58313/g.104746 Transcript_58313/m.104746 type:complete len:504 (-) Transcript_58313:90-1601(-)
MFLSKDFLNGEGEQLPMRPATSSGQGGPMARPGSAYGRPATSASCRGSDNPDEDGEDQSTPNSAAGLRQKMLLQRQKALQKQRTGGVSAGGLVMANQGMPATPVAAASPSNSGTSLLAKSPTAGSSASMLSGLPSAPSPVDAQLESLRSPSSGLNHEPPNELMKGVLASMAVDGENAAEAVVMPNPMSPDEIKADEARRRASLAASLDERGLCPVFDPGPSAGPDPAQKSNFDVASIAPSEMKNFLLNPSPKNSGMIECRIIREKGGLSKLYPKYTLETDSGVFLMSAKKQKHNKTSKYVITMSRTDETGKDTDAYLGKLRSNFLGLEFVAYSEGMNPKNIDNSMSQVHAMQVVRQELLAVQYSSSLWGTKPRGPRKMGAVIPKVQPTGERIMCRTLNPDLEGLLSLNKANNTQMIHSYHNKPPKWNETVGAFVLNFNKRVTQASVKNFQLATSDDQEEEKTVFLQFGRVGKDVFNMDFRFPFSPFQAFAICLSSFDYKLCCE